MKGERYEHAYSSKRNASFNTKISKNRWKDLEFRKKVKKIMDILGLRTPDDKLSEKELYYRNVEFYTNLSLINFYNKINPKNKKVGRNKKDYSLDHKYSKIMGFKNNIDPKIIGHLVNLEIILFSENCKKRNKSSITKEELFRLYEEVENKNEN